jgi:ABC-type nitrate/sulfonate/bicarbonate transport system substrate-binding protein
MVGQIRFLLIIFGFALAIGARSYCNAETFRIGFPSLATGFAPSWVTAEKNIWKKYGLDVELIYLKIIGITPGRDAAYARVVKLLREHGMDAGKDVTFLSVGDGGPAARVAALSSGVIHASMFTPPSDMISEKAGMKILAKIDVANVGGGLNTTPLFLQKSRPQALRFLRGYMEGIQYMKSHKDESLKIFSKYVRNPDLGIMAYLYDEIATRVEPGLRPQPEAVRALLDLAAQDLPQAKRLTEKDNWDLSLIDEIQKSGFLDQLYKQ